MKILFDLHTHTLMSGHAYSTPKENIQAAKALGLAAYGFSDHGPSIKGGPDALYFQHFRIFPRQYEGMYVLCGVEAAILDYEGHIDLTGKPLERVDYAIASLHQWALPSGTLEENMQAYIGAMRNPYVKIIGHPDDSTYPVDYEQLVLAAKQYKVALELNESSLDPASVRAGQVSENMAKLIFYSIKHDWPLILGSDAHHESYIGRFERVLQIVKEEHLPERLLLNSSLAGLKRVLNKPELIEQVRAN
ncbi:phosphatase [Amygdalobacter nucleatus]|uniref:Putative hydrolase n=1 Tax=Amygdalobacter nucleatus TaxID=3029274 RepID=A0A133YC56_9FIRM|nr:phosphatase [Amygdalobacter nucleatus]KXB40796.1 putative hydrolase [Amygdalobacter nucleatus]MDF0485150.1 phosphatase [Amygdalobacter nucleatus]WEG36967.1 phosphatase [Amygdalobacter nucleatus]